MTGTDLASAGPPPVARRRSGRAWRVAPVAVAVLMIVAAGALAWRDSRIDLRAFDPVFSTAPGSFDCVAGLEAVLTDMSVEAPIAEAAEGCSSTFAAPPAGGGEAWRYRIEVELGEFATGSDSFYGSAAPDTGARECRLFADAGTVTRYIDGAGGFCTRRAVLPEDGVQRTLLSEATFARFGQRIAVVITVEPPVGADPLASHPVTAASSLAFLERLAASVFSRQLDPTGAIDGQMHEAVPAAPNTPGVFPETGAWCGVLGSVDLAAIANEASVRERERYEAVPTDRTSRWWGSNDAREPNCLRSWTVDRWPVASSAAPDERFGFAVGVESAQWPWGPDVLADEIGLRLAACGPVDGSVESAFEAVLGEDAGRLTRGYQCTATGGPAELLLLLDEHHLVRISTYSWDESGSAFVDSVTARWAEAVQREVADRLLATVADRG